ncbi:aspartate aminotransferase family protein [Geomicrobium sp. JCM 19038]|uniref:aspartate aminotransferase family protein n=1 Tax=Geomicrobium sp. JCM 19038 TaxID=1460635 RepID=UPI00045F331F|nr:aspartate aminotransferase family protein [Geomicrobium sp. JCM 19038]GAK09375.1 glutamate-1-semialdehyde aminotransferase [Geomicrobium sp. JCM 19038]
MGIANNRLSYEAQTMMSKRHMERAKQVMPGGMTANIKHFEPYPIAIKRAHGSRMFDVDGHEYIDYLMGYGALMLGHGHEEVKSAIQQQIEQDGTWLFGTPHEKEAAFAERLLRYFPSMESVRYTNSGTEANLLALRLAMAHTGKYKIAKFEGHYHGAIDSLLISVSPNEQDAGTAHEPNRVADSYGMDELAMQNTFVLPFNQYEHCEKILTEHADEIGALIVEPLEAGIIAPTNDFLQKLHTLTKKLNIVLIFDEVKTGFRTGMGGVQNLYNVEPDLTTMGKVVGGGFPFGVVGGKQEIMGRTSPLTGFDFFADQDQTDRKQLALFHSGTYNGHPLVLAAGLATLDVLEEEMSDLLIRTEQFKSELESIFKKHSLPMKAVGIGSLFSVLFTNKESLSNYRCFEHVDKKLRTEMDRALFQEGIYVKPGNRYSMSVAHDDEAIEKTIMAYEKVVPTLFPSND